jgi:DNA-directed RNA polymerase subunit E"
VADRRVCRECYRVLDSPDQQACPNCGSSSFTEDWAGYVIITHPGESEIAAEMEVTEPGRYALKVR